MASGDFSQERLRLVGELAAGVAHEVNNPLQLVLNNAYLIEASTEQPNISGYATEIQRTSAALSQLLGALFDLLRPERAPRVVDVAQALDAGLVLLGYLLRNAQLNVRVQREADVFQVYGDPGLLQLALLDILRAILDAEKLGAEKLGGEIETDGVVMLCVARVVTSASDSIEFSAEIQGAEPVCFLARRVAERWGGSFRCETRAEVAGVCKLVLSLPAAV